MRFWVEGPWRVEVRGDELADIRYAGRPVLRSVRGVVRDQDGRRFRGVVRHVAETDEGLELSLDLVGFGAEIEGRLALVATTESLTVTFDAYVRKAVPAQPHRPGRPPPGVGWPAPR